jgi:hypothetical protein
MSSIFILLIIVLLFWLYKKQHEGFKVYGGSPGCPYKDDESCPWMKQGTGPSCQIKENRVGCPACCGNIDWYLGEKKYQQKCPDQVPPAFKDVKDYYASIQENFLS